jgi:hypothetical protein
MALPTTLSEHRRQLVKFIEGFFKNFLSRASSFFKICISLLVLTAFCCIFPIFSLANHNQTWEEMIAIATACVTHTDI